MKRKSGIARGGYKPSSPEEAKKLTAEFILGTIGADPTVISQQMLLNIANYNYLISVLATGKDTPDNQALLHKTVKELNEFCRINKEPLGLLIMPHTSISDYSGDEVVAIPWTHVIDNPLSRTAINSLFETVISDGYSQFVEDAKTVEGYNVL